MSKTAPKPKAASDAPVLDFFVKLATEPETMTAFLRNPAVVMEEEGLDEKVREALTSGDPMRVHRSISPTAAADERAAEQSMTNAKEVQRILSSDRAVAAWLQHHYFTSIMTWLAGGGSAAPALAAPVQVQSDDTPQHGGTAKE